MAKAVSFVNPIGFTRILFRPKNTGLFAPSQRRIVYQKSTSKMSVRTQNELVSEVLDHWFGSRKVGWFDTLSEKGKLWYEGSKEIDDDIRERFGKDVEKALQGGWDHLIGGNEHPVTGELALVIMLDQYTRNIYRGSADAFSGDKKSRDIAYHVLDSDQWQEAQKILPPIMRLSFLMPLMHGESLKHQDDCVEQVGHLIAECEGAGEEGAECAERMRYTLDFAKRHRKIIGQFGRYPYRNKVLGRETTPEEEKFLVNGDRFGQ